MKSILLIISFLIILQSCASWPFLRASEDSITQLQRDIRYLLEDHNLGNAYIGIYVESLDDNKILFRQNEHKLFVPASNMKLYTTAAGLVKLGKQFRYQTIIGTDSLLSDSTLSGNLIIRGMGDPSISGRFSDGDILANFKNWSDSLTAKGIKRIQGKLIVDNSYFESDILADGWNWDDEPFWYSAQSSATSFNDNCVDFSIRAENEQGAPLTILQYPDIAYLKVENTAVTSAPDSLPDLNITRLRAQNVACFSGTLPLDGVPVQESISVERPAEYFVKVFNKTLQDKGIIVEGGVAVCNEFIAIPDTLLIYHSPELTELIKVLNKKSHNLYAEQLLKTLGKCFGQEGSFKKGSEIVTDWLQSIGVPPSEFIMVDGSGLSRKNFVSPFASVTLLKWMYKYPQFLSYYNSLPIAGVDGTLKDRMQNSAAQGNLRAKTGYVRHMRNLSGYVNGKNKKPYVFSIMINNYSVPTPYINELQNKICILLSNLE